MDNFTFGKGKQADLKAQIKGNPVNQSGNQECIELLEKCQCNIDFNTFSQEHCLFQSYEKDQYLFQQLEIIRDDKNILRQLIKDGNNQVISIIKNKKKQMDQMQTELKKYLKQIKSSSGNYDGDNTQSKQINDNFNSGQQIGIEKQQSRNSITSINANINNQYKGTQSGTKRPSQDFQNTQFIQVNKQTTPNIKPQTIIPINQNKVVSLTPILEQTPTSDKQRSLSSQNVNQYFQKSPSISSSIPTDQSLTPNSSRVQKNNSMYQQPGNNNFPFTLTITTTTAPQPAMTPQIIIPPQQTNNPSQIMTPQTANPPSLSSINTSQKLGSASKIAPQYTTSPPKISSPPKSNNTYQQGTEKTLTKQVSGNLKKVPSVPKYGHHMPTKKDSDSKTPQNQKLKSPINKSSNSNSVQQHQSNQIGKQKVNKTYNFESGFPSQTPQNINMYSPNQGSESSIQTSQKLSQPSQVPQVNTFQIDPAFTPQDQFQQPKPSIQPQIINNQSQNKSMTFGISSQPFGTSTSPFGIAAQDQPEKRFSINSSLQQEKVKNQEVQNKYFNLNTEQSRQDVNQQQSLLSQQKEILGQQYDQNLNKDTIEKTNNGQNTKNKQLFSILQPSVPQAYSQTNYLQGTVQTNKFPFENKIQLQEIKTQTQNNQFVNEKMFTFESPHKVNEDDPQNKFFSTDGKVIYDDKSKNLETPPKRSSNTQYQQSQSYKPEDQINNINQYINVISSEKVSQNPYNTSDKKQPDQYSQSERKYPEPINSQSYKYQNEFEKNIYGQNSREGGISQTIPSNKFEIQSNNYSIGQNYSYGEGLVKQISQPFTQQKDQNNNLINYQYQNPMQDSQREFQSSTVKNANTSYGQDQFIKENKPFFESFSEQSQFKTYDPVQKGFSTSFNDSSRYTKPTEEKDILFQITDKLSQLHSPREEQPKQTAYNQYTPSYNLVNSIKYEEIEKANTQRDALPSYKSNSQNQISDINQTQYPSQNTPQISMNNNFSSTSTTNNFGYSSPINNFGAPYSTNNVGNSYSNNIYQVSPSNLQQGSAFTTNNYTSTTPTNNNFVSSLSNNYFKDSTPTNYMGDTSLNSYRISSASNHVGPDSNYFKSGQTNNNYGNVVPSNQLENKMEQSAPIENRYNYQSELDGSSSSYIPQRYSQPSNSQDVNKFSNLKSQQYGSTEALNNYQNKNMMTDWKSLNEKIEDSNKKFSLEFDVNSKMNAKKPFQFTSVQSPQEFTSNQQSSSFSYDPLRLYKAESLDKQKPSYSFVQPPNISTDYYNQTSDNNQFKTSSLESTTEKFKLPPLNSEIQSILDRYIPKSTPQLLTERSFNFNQSLTPTGYNTNPIQIPVQDDFLEKIKKSQNSQIYQENQLDSSLEKSKELDQETNQKSNLQAHTESNQPFNQINNQDFKVKVNQGSNKKNSLLSENETFKIILNGGSSLNFNRNAQNQQQNLYQSNDFGNDNFKINTLDSQRSLVSSTNLQNDEDSQPEKQKNEIYISDSYTTLNVPGNYDKKKEYSISVHESLQTNQNKDNMYINGSFCELPDKPKRAVKISVASILSSRQLKKEKLNVFSSNTLSNHLAYSCDDLSSHEKSGVLSQKTLLSFPRLKHQLSKYTCEQVLEQIFDSFSLSLQYLTKDYFVYRMQTLVKQFVPNILSMELISKEISALFEAADLNQNWQLDINELGVVFQQLCQPSEDSPIKVLFKSIDTSNSGQVTMAEFQNFAKSKGYDQVAFTKQNIILFFYDKNSLFRQLDSIKKNHVTYFDFLLHSRNALILSIL